MYKIILKYTSKLIEGTNTLIFTYSSLNYCRKQIRILKDRYIFMGATILELKIYKVEQIQDSEQI